ncbi:hypothetical protein [Argonema antarcticum]|uniref:hypothetical protein n=1 Tax=Argonema antarcticum TaxID=2942763 RepID=UPI0020120BAB|nr:hypothetical protein [Argonema antarcticum]MCL1472333.1 hypothetical protein [Argonema antarcticum A004/B2]
MNYKYNRVERDLQLDSFEEQVKLGLEICGELLVESRHIILGALAWKGWIEKGRCVVFVNLEDRSDFEQEVELPMLIILQNEPLIKLFGVEEIVKQYDPESEGVLIMCHSDRAYCLASVCIFTPGYPPRICYEEVKGRPVEFDFSWADNES